MLCCVTLSCTTNGYPGGPWLKPCNVKLRHLPLAPALQTLQILKCLLEVQAVYTIVSAHKSLFLLDFLREKKCFFLVYFLREKKSILLVDFLREKKSLQNSPTLLLRPDCARSWTVSRRKRGKVVWCEREIWVKLTNQPPDAVCHHTERKKIGWCEHK